MSHIRITDAQIAQAIGVLQRYHAGEMMHARAELEGLWDMRVGEGTLCHAFKLRDLDPPSTYLLPRRSAAERLAASEHGDVPRAGSVGSSGGVSAGSGGRYLNPDTDTPPRINSAQVNGSVVNKPVGRGVAVNPPVWDRNEPRKPKPIAGTGSEDLGKNPLTDPSMHIPTAPNLYRLRGVSTLVDAAGNPVMQWIKTAKEPDADLLAELFDAIEHFPDEWKTHHEPVKMPDRTAADLLAVYPVADPHLGMYAWAEETGANYDVATAERLHVQAIKSLVAGAPPAKQALVCSLGDFLHADSNAARTERSGNPLDVDTRFAHVLRVGIRTFCAMIDAALEKHEKVRVICEIGNHDAQASAMLAMAMDLYYRRDERVSVDMSPARFHYFRFGKCLFGTTHGSDAKADKLPMVMARDRAADWGQTEFRKWLVGHFHQERVQCFPGCKVEFYRTLAGQDAWAHGNGYRSDRGMLLEVYHREHGFVGSSYVGLNQLEAA